MTLTVYRADNRKVKQLLITDKSQAAYERAVRAVAEEIVIDEVHPAFDSLSAGCLAMFNGCLYGTSVDHLLKE